MSSRSGLRRPLSFSPFPFGRRQVEVVAHEGAELRHLVIERPGARIALLGLPVDRLAAGLAGLPCHRLDKRPADTAAAHRLRHEKVLQIAGRRERPGGLVHDVVHQTDSHAVTLGQKSQMRAVTGEAGKDRITDGGGKRLAVKGQIGLPENVPRGTVGRAERTHDQARHFRGFSHPCPPAR